MTTRSDYDVLIKAIKEVSGSALSMEKLAKATVTRPHCESEWVYEIDGTRTLEGLDCAREVTFERGKRADLRIRSTLIEFKSTRPWYAATKAFEKSDPPKYYSAEGWFGSDLRRMATVAGTVLRGGLLVEDGMFVLMVSADGRVGTREFKQDSAEAVRLTGVDRYFNWLREFAESVRPGAEVTRLDAGGGTYHGQAAFHDALIVRWLDSGGAPPAMSL